MLYARSHSNNTGEAMLKVKKSPETVRFTSSTNILSGIVKVKIYK